MLLELPKTKLRQSRVSEKPTWYPFGRGSMAAILKIPPRKNVAPWCVADPASEGILTYLGEENHLGFIAKSSS